VIRSVLSNVRAEDRRPDQRRRPDPPFEPDDLKTPRRLRGKNCFARGNPVDRARKKNRLLTSRKRLR